MSVLHNPRIAVVMSGLPASGKSSLGRSLASQLGWPVLDKDDFLEARYEQQPVERMEERRKLSRLSDGDFQAAASELERVVLVSHWTPATGPVDTGTATAWVAQTYDRVIEVYCKCPADVAIDRFHNRTRHRGHLDAQRPRDRFAAWMAEMNDGYPLDLGTVLEVDTTQRVDLDALCAHIAALTA